MEVDRAGRISNWPEGFMDADIHESSRLMDAMYGALGRSDDDDASDESKEGE